MNEMVQLHLDLDVLQHEQSIHSMLMLMTRVEQGALLVVSFSPRVTRRSLRTLMSTVIMLKIPL